MDGAHCRSLNKWQLPRLLKNYIKQQKGPPFLPFFFWTQKLSIYPHHFFLHVISHSSSVTLSSLNSQQSHFYCYNFTHFFPIYRIKKANSSINNSVLMVPWNFIKGVIITILSLYIYIVTGFVILNSCDFFMMK